MKNKLGILNSTSYTINTNSITIIADSSIDISDMKTTIADLKAQRDTQNGKILKLKQEINDLKVTNSSSESAKEGIDIRISSIHCIINIKYIIRL